VGVFYVRSQATLRRRNAQALAAMVGAIVVSIAVAGIAIAETPMT
jgi:hypothetical protein